jgi:hypothetical protein
MTFERIFFNTFARFFAPHLSKGYIGAKDERVAQTNT